MIKKRGRRISLNPPRTASCHPVILRKRYLFIISYGTPYEVGYVLYPQYLDASTTSSDELGN